MGYIKNSTNDLPHFLMQLLVLVSLSVSFIHTSSATTYITETARLPYSVGKATDSCRNNYESQYSSFPYSGSTWNADPDPAIWEASLLSGNQWRSRCQATICFAATDTYSAVCYYYPSFGGMDGQDVCPQGYGYYSDSKTCKKNAYSPDRDKPKPVGCLNPTFGNPVEANSGIKLETERDYVSSTLQFTRYYTSRAVSVGSHQLGTYAGKANWSHNFNYQIISNTSGGFNNVFVITPNSIVVYQLSANGWIADSDINDQLIELKDNAGLRTGWQRSVLESGNVETYDVSGNLIAFTDRAGLTQTLSYSNNSTAISIAPVAGLLIKVTDTVGNHLDFAYDSNARISTLNSPSGLYQYNYDANSNLSVVTYPDSKFKTYIYETGYSPTIISRNVLVGILDENGNRYATWTYDDSAIALTSEHAGGVEKYSANYYSVGNNPATDVTEPNGTVRTYNFNAVLGVVKSTGQNQPAGSGCNASASNLTYDASGNVATKTDFNGYLTQYGYDTNRNLETTRTEGLNGDGTSRTEARTITTTWHPTWRLPLAETTYNGATASGTPIYKITRSYDTHGNLTQITETDPVRSRTRTTNTSYTYSSIASGLIVQKVVDGARTDVNDITTYNYYDTNATCVASTDYPNITNLGCRGQLQSMTDPLGHITQYHRYNPNGQLEQMTDANGTVISYTYTPRQWIKTITVTGNTTTFDYDYVGQIKTSTLADGSYLSYSYDDAHRLTDITDAAGHTIHYTLDSSGNRTKEEYRNADGSNAQEINRVYDALNRLQTEIHGSSTQAGYQYGYYANGEAKTSTTANNAASQYTVDALGRPTQLIDPINGSSKPTASGYDALNRITQLTTPNGSNTQYTLDGLGNTLTEVSSEAGNLQATYDDAGNLKTQLDARGVTTTYSYDALNRLTSITTPTVGSITATSTQYTWDVATGCTHGIGRLCKVTDVAGSTTFNYDNRGNRIGEVRTEVGTSFNNIFTYNNADSRTDNISATVETVSVTRDNTGKVASLTATSSSNLFSAIAQGIAYNANGQVSTQTLGQSTNTLSYDVAGRLATVAGTDSTTTGGTGNNGSNSGDVPLPPWAIALMGLGLLTMIQRRSQLNDKRARHTKINSTNSLLLGLIFSCSLLTGLNTQSAYAADLTIQYDNDGNPTSKTTPNGTSNYTYDALDRIKTESGQNGNKTHTFDGNNNRTSDGAGTTQAYTPNTDKLATYNGINVTLDAAGHIIFDGTYRYVWDGLNQLSELHKADNTLLATYYYDYRGLRTRKVTTASAPQGVNTFFYFYDPDYHLIAETGGATLVQAHTPQMTYIWNDSILTGIIVHQPSRTAYTVDVDHLGSPYQVRTLAGKVVWRWDSDAFGTKPPNEDVDGDGNKLTLNLRFPGQYYDQESGLYYNVKRYYSAKLARYLSPDPIGLAGGNNRFSYVGGQPTRLVDPSGEFFVVPAVYYGALGIASVGAAWWAASHQPVMSSGASSDGDFAFTESPPKRASENGCASPEKKNCEALRQSILKTCFGLTGRKRMACFEAANTAYRQCMGYE